MNETPDNSAAGPALEDCWNTIGVRGDGSCE